MARRQVFSDRGIKSSLGQMTCLPKTQRLPWRRKQCLTYKTSTLINQRYRHCYVYKLTISSTESFARDIITTHPTIGPGVGDEMASTQSMKTTQTPSWNNAAIPLALIIPTFTLSTRGAVEAITTAHIPAPTRIGPTIPAEGSGNVVWSSTTR